MSELIKPHPTLRKNYAYFLTFISLPQQIKSHTPAQPHAVSTDTIIPQTLHAYLVPFFMDDFAVGFFTAGFVLTADFFATGFALAAGFLVAIYFLLTVLLCGLFLCRCFLCCCFFWCCLFYCFFWCCLFYCCFLCRHSIPPQNIFVFLFLLYMN